MAPAWTLAAARWALLAAATLRGIEAVVSTPVHEFLSRPDIVVPRLFVDAYNESAVAPGYIFLSPFFFELYLQAPDPDNVVNFMAGPMIYDNHGDVVWAGTNRSGRASFPRPQFGTMGFERCEYAGKSHLCTTHWHPDSPLRRDIIDNHYRTVQTITPNGKSGGLPLIEDTHEFNVKDTPTKRSSDHYHEQTALVSLAKNRELDAPLHHPGCDLDLNWVVTSVFQEISLWDNSVLFQWDSDGHIPIENTSCPGADGFWRDGSSGMSPFDTFHINAVDKDVNGDYYVSGRHVSTIYKISGKDGSIIWQVGKAGNKFKMISEVEGIPAEFGFQHHLRLREDYPGHDLSKGRVALSLYDNANSHYDFNFRTSDFSSGKIFLIDEHAQTATLKEAFKLGGKKDRELSTNQGTFQPLSNGNRFLSGGNVQELVEWQPGNPEPVFQAHWGEGRLPDGSYGHVITSYRGERWEWTGLPLDTPTVFAFAADCGARTTSYVSWNGATEVAQWRVWGSVTEHSTFALLGEGNRTGFETHVDSAFANYVVVVALNATGHELGRSPATRVSVLAPAAPDAPWPCGPDRCDAGFDYATHAARECPPAIINGASPMLLEQAPSITISDEEVAEMLGQHCDPCFGPFKQIVT